MASWDVDIVIPVWNQADLTVKCLQSIGWYSKDYRIVLVDNASDPAIEQMAKLRLGGLLLDMGKPDDAKTLAQSASQTAFAGEFSALRGDIALVKGDKEAAKQAWQQALDEGAADVTGLRMKLTSVGG